MRVSFSQAQKNDPGSRSGVKIPYSPGKRKTSKILWWSILALVFTPLAVLLWNIFAGWIFVTSPGMITMDSYAVKAPESGYIKDVFIKKGLDAGAGFTAMTLVRQPSPEILERIALMKAERDALEISLKQAKPLPAISTKAADQNVVFFKKELETMKRLMDQGAATRAEVNLAEQSLRSAVAQRGSLLSARAEPSAANDIRSRIDYLERSISYLEGLNGSSYAVTLKNAGRVQSVEVVSGQSVRAGQELMWIADPATAKVTAYVAPENFAKIKLDTEANVVLPGRSKKIRATVQEMPTLSQSTPGGLGSRTILSSRSVTVYLSLKDPLPDDRIVDGLPVKVEWGLRSFF